MHSKECLCDAQGTCSAEKALEEQASSVRRNYERYSQWRKVLEQIIQMLLLKSRSTNILAGLEQPRKSMEPKTASVTEGLSLRHFVSQSQKRPRTTTGAQKRTVLHISTDTTGAHPASPHHPLWHHPLRHIQHLPIILCGTFCISPSSFAALCTPASLRRFALQHLCGTLHGLSLNFGNISARGLVWSGSVRSGPVLGVGSGPVGRRSLYIR